jgi:glycosyltransferase involved in cell wall biosynthesis
MHRISAFILTLNSEKYLGKIVTQLQKACDEIVVVDSDSADETRTIAESLGCRFFFRPFDNFKNQRAFALEKCSYNLVLMIDSDEVPDNAFLDALNRLKASDGLLDAYRMKRVWFALGKKIHAVYPVVSPDYPVRLFDKRRSNFKDSPIVHEEPSGYESIGVLEGAVRHYTFETQEEIAGKLERYASLSAETLLNKKKNLSVFQQLLSSAAAFIKWYFAKGGWRDGVTGMILAKYAFDYTFLKYRKARRKYQVQSTEY